MKKIIPYSIALVLGVITVVAMIVSSQPIQTANVDILPGTANPEQKENLSPKIIHVVIGINNTIRWNNLDDTAHTLTPDHRSEGFPDAIGLLRSGESQEFTFEIPGVYDYHGEPGPWITGTVIVSEPSGWWN